MDFTTDKEKMVDFFILSKEEFLASYSYLTIEEYEETVRKVIETMNENLKTIAEFYKEDMVTFIGANWDVVGGEIMSRKEAEYYLGHSVKGMTNEEINEEVSEIQRTYYTEGIADLDEIVKKFVEIVREV